MNVFQSIKSVKHIRTVIVKESDIVGLIALTDHLHVYSYMQKLEFYRVKCSHDVFVSCSLWTGWWHTVCGLQKAAASAFSQMLRRYTALNHLAQAARTVLQNKAQVNKMHQDLCKVDFVHIQVTVIGFCVNPLTPCGRKSGFV